MVQEKLNAGVVFQGGSCYRFGMKRTECPYAIYTEDAKAWLAGWNKAAEEKQPISVGGC
jgi:ribosome modulation factor